MPPEDHAKPPELWATSPIECTECGYEWQAAYPLPGPERFECPACHEMAGERA